VRKQHSAMSASSTARSLAPSGRFKILGKTYVTLRAGGLHGGGTRQPDESIGPVTSYVDSAAPVTALRSSVIIRSSTIGEFELPRTN